MKRTWLLACVVTAALPCSLVARADDGPDRHAWDRLIATHAKANLVPEALVHRVIVRESKYHPGLVGRGGTVGLMQLKLATARGVGYSGDAEGLRDPETNLAYGIKYLAGAWRAARGDHDRAMHYYASGYYYVAKQQRLERLKQAAEAPASAAPKQDATPLATVVKPKENAQGNAKAAPITGVNPAVTAAKPKPASRKQKDAKAQVPRPAAAVPSGANDAKPR